MARVFWRLLLWVAVAGTASALLPGSATSSTISELSTAASHVYDTHSAPTTFPANTRIVAAREDRRPMDRSRSGTSRFALSPATQGTGDILPSPSVSDPKLKNFVADLYRGTTNPNRIGTGTTADAVRHELATGQRVGGKFHIQKARDTARGLQKWLRKNPNANRHDRLVARSLYDELGDAFGGRP